MWSVWDRTDRIVAIIDIIALIVIAISFCSCTTSTDTKVDDIPQMYEYPQTQGQILFYPYGVIDFIYDRANNQYYLEYDDVDCFDPEEDNMCFNEDESYYYIKLYCDSATFFHCMAECDFLVYSDNPRYTEESDKFYIVKTDSMYQLIEEWEY